MPVAIPTWRNVLLAPEAMPLRCGCTTDTAAEARTGLTVPTPAPHSRKPGNRTVQAECGLVVAMNRSPPVIRIMPIPSRRRECTRTVSRPAKNATPKDISVRGRKRAPAASGP